MSEEMQELNELDVLKARATKMGLKFSPNIGVETLRTKIENALNGTKEEEQPKEEPTVSKAVKDNQLRSQLRKDALKLIRIRVTDLDPKKKDLPGEILCAANEFVGTVKRYVPYNGEPWHVEQIILNMMQDRKFLSIKTVKKRGEEMSIEKKWVKEYAIEILEPLTKEELAKLANAQAAAGSVQND